MVANSDIAENLCAGSYDDAITNCRVPFTFFFARAAERDALINQNAVTDLGCLADDYAVTMVNEEPAPDSRPRVNFDAGQKTRELGDKSRNQRQFPAIQPVRK